jgi:cytochrome oxidase Cu insertion factor (SCO1/SenC/PrrC family)
MSRPVLFWLAVLFFAMGGTLVYLGFKHSPAFTAAPSGATSRPAAYKPSKNQPKLTEYELTERSERKIGSKELDGKLHLVSFFFATCPGSCKTQNTHFAALEKEFGNDGVKFVAITCDPETDTPAKLREYASQFNAGKDSWYFLRGDLYYTQRVANDIYQVGLAEKTHVERFILVDRKGKIRGRYSWARPEQLAELRQDLRKLIVDNDVQTAAEQREAQEAAKAAGSDEEPS